MGLLDPAAISGQQATFRSVVDVIAVDVQVVDSGGNPVDRIGPDAFEVSINGQRRKVISAEFVRHGQTSEARSAQEAGSTGRIFILAIDSGSFEVGTERAPLEGARAFVERLEPSDRVGLYVYPGGARVEPTTERASIGARLDRVVGEKEPLRSRYNLKPYEIVDITAQATNPNSFLVRGRGTAADPASASSAELDPVLRIARRECPEQADCPINIYSEGMGLAAQLERQAQESLSGLEALLRGLAEMPGRKAVVLVSAGVVVSDRKDGRPDVGDLARIMGQTAARANATVYTVQVDAGFTGSSSASQRGSGSPEFSRDRALYGNWLNDFSQAAGGRLIYVPVGPGGFAFDRVLRETSAYYLLGVEPAAADRDGQPRELRVKVNRQGVNVRSRQWVVVPVRG